MEIKSPQLQISLVQSSLQWENIDANLQHFDTLLEEIPPTTDLIVLPEMFNTGFTMNAQKVAEKMNGKTLQWLQIQAQKRNAAITGSLVIEENGLYYNRLVWMFPNGTYHTYDKRHLFRMAREHETYTAGDKCLVVNYKGWKIRPLICYDLRFPVWSRNRNNAYDVLIYVANWPQVRAYIWSNLLQARAIENLAYVIGVNRVGMDANQFAYSGDSALVDFAGKVVWSQANEETIAHLTLSKPKLEEFRKRFPAWMDADDFEVY